MTTVYDFLTIVLFAGLAVLFLQRSVGPENPRDRIYLYAPPSIGCLLANWLGNQHFDLAAVAVIFASLGYTLIVLKPFSQNL